jgi:hypothetical protein
MKTHLSLCSVLLLHSNINQKSNELTNFSKFPSIKFHHKPFSCSKMVTPGQIGTGKGGRNSQVHFGTLSSQKHQKQE